MAVEGSQQNSSGREAPTGVSIVEESVEVGKHRTAGATVRVTTKTREHEVVVNEPLGVERVEVERVRLDRWVESPPDIRQEGDTTIVPVLEEVVVTEKRLKLVEEVRITKRQDSHRAPQQVSLRRQEAVVERLPASGPRADGPTNEHHSEKLS